MAIVGGLIYVTKGLYWLDSVVALVVGGVVAIQAGALLKAVVEDMR